MVVEVELVASRLPEPLLFTASTVLWLLACGVLSLTRDGGLTGASLQNQMTS